MTDKTMPERITVHITNNDETFPDNACITELKPGALLPDNLDEAEYVRADLAAGDAGEPLEDGQHRWFMPYYEDVWRVGVVRTVIEDEWECFAFCTAPGEWLCEFEVDKIGPVIRPPEDV